MRTVLIDTHAFLWFIAGSEKLSHLARKAIEDEENEIVLSVASIWEMSIKVSIGKLSTKFPLRKMIPEQMECNGFDLLPIEAGHCMRVSELPMHHRDPFDRLLIAQALEDNMPVVTTDGIFDQYGISRIW